MIQRPCLTCGALTTNTTRCEPCRLQHQRAQDAKRDKSKRKLYAGGYAKRAKEVRDTAEVCWLCGQRAADGDPWQADHVEPTDVSSPLRAAHRSCNIKRALEDRRNKPGGGSKFT